MDTKFTATITDNLELSFADVQKYKQHLMNLKSKNKPVSVIIKLQSKGRSDNQNAYYWAVVIGLIAENCGYRQSWEREELHGELKRLFLPSHGPLKISQSTGELNTVEFEEYLSKIRQWASEYLSLYIPLPNEVNF
jgi:hypothetical protein